ncbi:MAG: hypothetical protein PHS33_09645 [Candidatus Omnitrophica bacterium]|nr:hypothetical protein [Candidatus Omnitrophota bacterium]
MVKQKQENKADKAGLTAIKKLHQNIKKELSKAEKPLKIRLSIKNKTLAKNPKVKTWLKDCEKHLNSPEVIKKLENDIFKANMDYIFDATIKLCKSKLEQCKPIYETMKPEPARFKDTQSDKLFIERHLTLKT